MKLIDKDALLAKIDGEIKLLEPYLGACAGQIVAEANAKLSVLEKLKNFLDTIEVKEVNLEKEIKDSITDEWCDEWSSDVGNWIRYRRGTTSMTVEDVKDIAKHFFELGLQSAQKEEPKKCMYSKDDYTDEDRKVLCDGCEAECIEKVKEERKRDLSLWSLGDFENNFFEIIKPYKDSHNYKNLCIRLAVWRSELWRWIDWKKRIEEPISEDLKEAANDYAVTVYNNYLDNPKAFENKDADTLNEDAFKAGAKWKERQFEKNRLAHCDKQTKEEAEKDLELTWEDMMLIHKCIKDAMNYHLYKMMEGVEGQKIVYQEVLKRFKDLKKEVDLEKD